MEIIKIEVPVTVRYGRTPYHPAKTSGPPENCYEAEGGELEFEIDYEGVEEAVEKAILEDEKETKCRLCGDPTCAGYCID